MHRQASRSGRRAYDQYIHTSLPPGTGVQLNQRSPVGTWMWQALHPGALALWMHETNPYGPHPARSQWRKLEET
jgi:hypothetical protein